MSSSSHMALYCLLNVVSAYEQMCLGNSLFSNGKQNTCDVQEVQITQTLNNQMCMAAQRQLISG